MKYYKLDLKDFIEESNGKLYRIIATQDFKDVKKGDKGGYIDDSSQLINFGWVYDNSTVNNSRVNNSRVDNNSTVNNSTVNNSTVDIELLKNNIVKYIALTCGFYPINNKYVLYKRVNKVKEGEYLSLQDSNFKYFDNQIAEELNYDSYILSSCSKGLHISGMYYWNEGDTLIQVECNVEDVITCREGKLRVKKLRVIGEVKL